MEINNNIDNKKIQWMIILIGISIFLFNGTVRSIIMSKLGYNFKNFIYLNVPYIIFASLVLIRTIKDRIISTKTIFTELLLFGLIIINTYFITRSLGYFISIISFLLIPLAFSTIKLNGEIVKKVFERFLNIYNILIIILLIWGTLDYLLKGNLQLAMANNWINSEMSDLIKYEHSYGIYRMYSFLGHPLTNAEYFLIFYCLNNISYKYFKAKINPYIISFVTILGLLLSGSRTALIFVLFLMLFNSGIKKHKWIYIIILSLTILFFYNSNLFQENLMLRYSNQSMSNDGRNILLKDLINSNVKRPRLFIGGGNNYSREVSVSLNSSAKNFEYPLIMFFYDYGIFESLLIYIIILIYPMLIFLKHKCYNIILSYTAIFLYVNGNNGLANFSEAMTALCFIIMLLVGVSYTVNDQSSPI